MAVPGNNDSGANPSLFSSIQSFWTVIVTILYTRLDLATTELEELGIHAVQLVVVGLAALLCVATAFLFAMFFFLALFWDTHYRLLVLGIIFAIYAIGGAVFILIARQMIINRPKILGHTLAELRRDVESLRPPVKINEAKP